MKLMHYLLLLLCLCCLSCGSRTDYPNLLTKADSLIDARPDSALSLLHSILPSALEEDDRMRHRLLAVEAECRCGIFTVNDSVVSTLVDYFRQRDDVTMLAKVYYCRALLYSGRQQYDMALITYRKAIPYVRRAQDWRLLGRIYGNMGYLLQNNGLDVQADFLYLQAKQMAFRSGDTLLWAETLHRQAIYQLGRGREAYPKAEQLLQQSYNMLDDDRRSGVSLSFSYLYSRMKRSDLALHYAKEAVRLSQRDSSQLFRAYVVLGDVFYQTAQYDSACCYFLQSMRSEASEVKMNACIRLADIARKQEDWKLVAYYQDLESKYREMYSKQEQREEIILAEKDLLHQQEQSQMKRLILICLAAIGALAVCIVLLLGRRARERKRLRGQMDALMKFWWKEHRALLSAEPSVVEPEVLLLPFNEPKETHSLIDFDDLVSHLRETELYAKVTRILSYHQSYNDYEEHFTVEDQNELLNLINRFTDGFITRLEKQVSLSEKDLRFCGLHLLGLSTQDIAILLEKDRSGVYKRQKRLLHQYFPDAGDEKLEKVLKSIK